MEQFRLHIDIPLGTDEEQAIEIAKCIMDDIVHQTDFHAWRKEFDVPVPEDILLNYRVGHDEDRQKSNYLKKTPDGHVTKKKNRETL